MARKKIHSDPPLNRDAVLRVDVEDAAEILQMSRAQLYKRIKAGVIRRHKDGARTYITCAELARYVQWCDSNAATE